MIQISLKGLAKFMTASAAGQRKVLRDYKYPDTEGQAQAAYYRDARNSIAKFHDQKLAATWLEDQAAALLAGSKSAAKPQIASRLKNNARALKCYAEHFGTTVYEVLPDVSLGLEFGGVLVTVNPDLHVTEKGKEKLLKLEFSAEEPEPDVIKVVSQAMFEAALRDGMKLASPQILYVDVPRGMRHKGARLGALTKKNIEAACSNIAAIWAAL
jgi:hypothetical protein